MVIGRGGDCVGAVQKLVLTQQCSPSGRINLVQHSAGEQSVLEDVVVEQ